ncbi:hypothetical protein [Engelhardtia mirabilis]|uniref:Uncharacterized protein n=1 Tax=Engelhardtia mirabilis TaxID=2528011 RepID=A0A518BHF0_9BACT|nr:hypothetical protein Pla133_14670 [Planctomycetes bacterium Pla133]QDV00722.1 hypothetical protein Pla86_14660 [Planctomycetes bacterium Pla86]
MREAALEADYQLGAEPVLLTVTIGNGQFGTSLVRLNSAEKCRGDIGDLELGKPGSLKGKKVRVKSVVTDVRDETNRLTVTYKLAGGAQDQTFVSTGVVENDGDSMLFRAIFNLKG